MTTLATWARPHHSDVRSRRRRRFGNDGGAPVEVMEGAPSLAGRLLSFGARHALRPVLSIGTQLPVPWPYGALDFVARALPPSPGTVLSTVELANCTAQLIRAKGVQSADGTGRVILFLHGGAFLAGGKHTHARLCSVLSRLADAPVLLVDYRLLPKHSLGQAIDDCEDGYYWLREIGYEADQIVLAGDSAGGYLSLALAERLLGDGEHPAALVAMSPLLQLGAASKQAHPNIHSDALFASGVFDFLNGLIEKAAARRVIDGTPEAIIEPLERVERGLPKTLIHVSGSEVMLHDARLGARRLADAGVQVEVRIWPGQLHGFQIAAGLVPEADRSLRQIADYIREATPEYLREVAS
ncbi:esterase [Mycobacterium sp. 852002-51163_SCH5372311]|uniref:alpha/beta hydrolase n=1 Tax=Mycobacterium sp. 852002-51163_SCH5372311 TaxID=1834097 RepID=UPI0007FE5689|nr:alpha/beta hydrolase [Mycobacterium sp. 852002-51163_SCH5372311]OBF85856.1 esterase [Mycobacterium sp. 852002-51163_SCH5372311]